MSNTGTGCAAVFEGVRCGKPLQSLVHSFKASGPYFSFNHPYLAPRTVTQQDGVTGEALGRTEPERCTFPGCGHTRTSHAYGDCLMRPCAAGSHYFNQLHSPTPAPKEEQSESAPLCGVQGVRILTTTCNLPAGHAGKTHRKTFSESPVHDYDDGERWIEWDVTENEL